MRTSHAILLVEDEWLIAEEFTMPLEDSGYTVIGPAPSTAAALQLLEAHALDAALLDLNLRGETSYRVAEALAARGIPFSFVTGYQGREIEASFRSRPCLQKPVESRKLLAAVLGLVAMP